MTTRVGRKLPVRHMLTCISRLGASHSVVFITGQLYDSILLSQASPCLQLLVNELVGRRSLDNASYPCDASSHGICREFDGTELGMSAGDAFEVAKTAINKAATGVKDTVGKLLPRKEEPPQRRDRFEEPYRDPFQDSWGGRPRSRARGGDLYRQDDSLFGSLLGRAGLPFFPCKFKLDNVILVLPRLCLSGYHLQHFVPDWLAVLVAFDKHLNEVITLLAS